MPITTSRRALYPDCWPLISAWVRLCAGWRCQKCDAIQGQPHPDTGSKVVLTVAHLDDDPTHNAPANLKALCQRCHLRLDHPLHVRNAAATRRARLAVQEMDFSRHANGATEAAPLG